MKNLDSHDPCLPATPEIYCAEFDRRPNQCQLGFTLIELVAVIVLLGIIAAVAIPRFGDITENSKVTATQAEMRRLQMAILGDPSIVGSGGYHNRGFTGDVGFAPSALADLVSKPGSLSVYNKFTRIGWNGPYIDSTSGEYLKDSWGVNYSYDPAARTITSSGGASPIVVSF